MNDVKARILVSWFFLLIMWPLGIYISVVLRSPNSTMTLFLGFCPMMAGIQRSKIWPERGTVRYYMPFLLMIGSLLLELFKIYDLFSTLGTWRFIIIIIPMLVALVWYIHNDIAILTGRKTGTQPDLSGTEPS